MKAKISFDFYHDGIKPTHYEPGDDLPGDAAAVALAEGWAEADEKPADEPGDDLPGDAAAVAPKKTVKKGK